MTVATTTNKTTPALTNGATVNFPFTFPVTNTDQLTVLLTDATTGAETTLVETTDYTVALSGSPAGSGGGTVTTITTYPAGYKITIVREVDLTQETDLDNQGGWFPQVHEDALDKLTMICQQLQEQVDRCIKLPRSVTGISTELPVPSANQLLAWDADGLAIVNASVVVPDASWVADTFTGTGAATTFTLSGTPISLASLDVSISGVTQVPTTDYTFSGTTLTFTSAPGNTLPILVRYRIQ